MEIDTPCAFCDNKSALLCDGVLARLCDEINPKLQNRKAVQFTCDLHICRPCARREGITHFNMKPHHVFDSKDLCPLCVKENRGVYDADVPLATQQEGEALQRRRHFHIAARTLKNPVKDILV